MTRERDIERVLDHWFVDGPSEAPDRVIDNVADRIERQSQRPVWHLHLRETHMTTYLKPLLAVAAVVAIAVVAYGLLPGSESRNIGAAASSMPTPSPRTSPTPTASPRPTPSPTPYPCGDGGTGCVGDLTAGGHRSAAFGPSLAYVVPDRWRNTIDNAFYYSLAGTDVTAPKIDIWSNLWPMAPGCSMAVQPGVANTVDGWIGWVTNQPGLVASKPRDVEVGGYPGKTLELRVAEDWTQTCQYMNGAGVWLVSSGTGFARDISGDATLTLTILDVAGETVMISVESLGTPADTAAKVAAAKPIIDSFMFTP